MIAIFDIGKTNKKLFLFDAEYKIVSEQSVQLDEIKDEDGFPCEDINSLTNWIKTSIVSLLKSESSGVQAVNFSAYGASFVHVDGDGTPLTPLYNYLKPFPEKLCNRFYSEYGQKSQLSKQTASPALGSLNSGLQLYRLKQENPAVFNRIDSSLHLPQYISSILSKKNYSELTSIGCHTALWDFNQNYYHQWAQRENILDKLATIAPGESVMPAKIEHQHLYVGVGLHDSSAALIPYLKSFSEPFALISTGTWSITLNPFNHSALTEEELKQDCLCYLDYKGKPVKASRLFIGREHEDKIRELSAKFQKTPDYYKTVTYDAALLFEHEQETYEEAYHHFMLGIVRQQHEATLRVIHNAPVKNIYVDGGFSGNKVYMHLMAAAFPGMNVYASTVAQASALGAALVLHERLNKNMSLDECSLIHTLLY